MPVDKYDLYQDFITDNAFSRKTVMEDIQRMLGESQDLLLTKDLLLPMVASGEKDVYLFNDSHWSYKATKAVARQLYERIGRKMPASGHERPFRKNHLTTGRPSIQASILSTR